MPKHLESAPLPSAVEPESLAELRGYCVRMAPEWRPFPETGEAPVPPSRIHGITVPARWAHLLDGMSDYGD